MNEKQEVPLPDPAPASSVQAVKDEVVELTALIKAAKGEFPIPLEKRFLSAWEQLRPKFPMLKMGYNPDATPSEHQGYWLLGGS